jgi:hypothetical protein
MAYTSKESYRKYYETNKHIYQERTRKRKKEFKDYQRAIKTKTPCMDCKVNYPHYVMDFDHRPDENKLFDVSIVSKISSTKKMLEEIAKCDIVCANCHRERTQSRIINKNNKK